MEIYYNKQTKNIDFEKTEHTISLTDKRMEDYNYFADNQKDKSLELVRKVGEIPYLERYELDENGNRYSHYLNNKVNNIYVPDLEKIEATKKEAEQQSIKSNFNKNEPTTILVDLLDGTQKELTFNCEEKSSLLIGESISLYERMGKTSVPIWDINNVTYMFSLEEANDIKDTLSKTYLDRLLDRQKQIQAIKG